MTTTLQHQIMHVVFAGAASIAMLAFVDATLPGSATATAGHVRLTTIDSPLPQSPFAGGLATDDGDDQAQLQQQLAQQEMQQQAEQQAEQQNEAAQQQALQAELQGQQVEQQANNPQG